MIAHAHDEKKSTLRQAGWPPWFQCVVVRAADVGFRAAVRLLGELLVTALSTGSGIGR